jgi:hypothetical protein
VDRFDAALVLMIMAPLAGAVLSALPWLASRRESISPFTRFWLDGLALVLVCLGLIASGALPIFLPHNMQFFGEGVTFTLTPLARLLLPALFAALVVTVLRLWEASSDDADPLGSGPYSLAWASCGVGALLVAAMLFENRTVQGLLLFGVVLVVAAAALGYPARDEDEGGRMASALRLAGGLKHLSIAATGTVLLLIGGLALQQHALNLEDRALLQLGVGMLAVGLLARVGAMPFAGAYTDFVRASPGLATLTLGAAVPGALAVGLLMLAPVESSLVNAQSPGWLGALAALTAGLRALGAGSAKPQDASLAEETERSSLAALLTMTAATAMGWALVGVLSGSRMGAEGASLLIINMALVVPLLLAGADRRAVGLRGVALGVGVASLLSLPLLGGSAGGLLVAQAAANHNGWWLAGLLLGTILTGAGWLGWIRRPRVETTDEGRGGIRLNVVTVLIAVLLAAQVGLFLGSGRLIDVLGAWTGVPWLGGQ